MATALIDADIVAWRAASVAQENIQWNDGNQGSTLSEQQALDSAEHIVKEWTSGARCKKAIMCFTSPDNFRRDISPDYKANRTGEKPELFNKVVEFLKDRYESYMVDRLEADDVMSIYATSEYVTNAVIVSIDKDLKTVPAKVFNPDKDRVPQNIRPQLADYRWMTQVLTGDASDGYKGIPNIGPKKAEKILSNARLHLPQLWETVVRAYVANGMTEEEALVQARLSRILRAEDFNKTNMEIKLWHPTKPTSVSLITKGKDVNQSTSSRAKGLASTKATSSNTLADGNEKEESKTSEKQSSISNVSSRTKPKRKKTKRKETSLRGTVDNVA